MKRHFSLLVSVLIVIVMVLTVASCELVPDANKANADAHQHTFSDAWQRDAANHWHAATCKEADCATAVASKAAHVDADNDKFCDVCAYDLGHEHSFGTEWVNDAENHWNVADCGHVAKANVQAHTFDAGDCCTVCGYTKEAIDVAKAVKIGASLKDLAKNGVIIYTSAPYAGATFSSYVTEYEFGDNLVYIKDGYSTEEYWYYMAEGNYFMPVKEYMSWDETMVPSLDNNADEAAMAGYGFANVFGWDGDTYYGVENLVSELYALATTNVLGGFMEYVSVVDGVTGYNFSFTYVTYVQEYDAELGEYVNTSDIKDLYQVVVEFCLADDYSISAVVVKSDKYVVREYGDDGYVETGVVTFLYEGEEDPQIVGYDITLFSPEASYSYHVAQRSGQRDLAPKYTPEKDLIASFDLELEDTTPVVETINMVVGTPLYLYLTNVAPETYNVAIDSFDVEDPNWGVNGSYNEYLECIVLNCYKAGEHTVTVSTTKVTKTYTVIATKPETTELNFEVTEGYMSNTIEEKQLYLAAGGSASFDFDVIANNYADAACAIAFKNATENASIVDNGDNNYTFTATALGTYEIVVTSTVADDVTSTLVVTVVEAPNVADILNGEFSATAGDRMSMTEIIAEFVPASEGAANGTLNISYTTSSWDGDVSGTAVYTYAYADGALTTTHVSGDEVGFVFGLNSDYAITVQANMYSEPVVMEEYTAPSAIDMVAGEYRYTAVDENYDTVYIIKLILNNDGTGEFVYMADYNSETWKYETNETDTFKFTVAVNSDDEYVVTISDVSADGKIAAGDYTVGSAMDNWGDPVDAVLGVSVTIDGVTNEFDMLWS